MRVGETGTQGCNVWIDRREPQSPAVLTSRRDLDRPARLRWLAGIRRDQEAWDAYGLAGTDVRGCWIGPPPAWKGLTGISTDARQI